MLSQALAFAAGAGVATVALMIAGRYLAARRRAQVQRALTRILLRNAIYDGQGVGDGTDAVAHAIRTAQARHRAGGRPPESVS